MESVHVERLDHLGLIASVIKDLGLVKLIDSRLKPDEQEEITPGEAIAGMILNGLGFANRPPSLTPQFFAGKPLDLLFRPGVEASMFNRFKLGRTLDEVTTYGSDLLFSELSLSVCGQEALPIASSTAKPMPLRSGHWALSPEFRRASSSSLGSSAKR